MLCADASNGWVITPRASEYNFGGCWGVHGPQNTPTLWRCIITGSALRAINTLNPPKKYIRKLGGLSPIHLTRRCGAQGLIRGARGPFPPAAAMVVAVGMPVVFCAKATEKQNKNTKISCLLPKSLLITFIVKHIVIPISLIVRGRARVVARPEPEPLLSNGPRHNGYCRKALVIVRKILTLY